MNRAAALEKDAPVLRVEGLAKSYGETTALKRCSLTIRRGSIHAVIGENGSGKSTLVKILSGVVTPDVGTISMAGKGKLHLTLPRIAREVGIATTFQEILILEELSLLDNLWLGQDRLFRRYVPQRRRRAQADAILAELLGDQVPDLDARVAELDLGTRQAVVIARSLLLTPRLLILDEATAALDISVRDRVFQALRRRVAAGLSALFITHKMDEIAALSDEVTVLRSGESMATLPIAEATPARMLHLMSGRSEAQLQPSVTGVAGPVLASVRGVRLAPTAEPFDLDVHRGEIIGLAGLEGHGADQFAQIIGGTRSHISGEIRKDDQVLLRPQDFMNAGIVYVPRDRKREGIFAPLSIADNFSIAVLPRHSRHGLIDEPSLSRTRDPLFARLGVKYGKLRQPITSLSGGNQQKVILARMLALEPQMLVLNDPTRGVDLATKQDIYGLLAAEVASGMSVVIHSTEIDELLALCDRVAAFHGATLYQVLAGKSLRRETLIASLFGRPT